MPLSMKLNMFYVNISPSTQDINDIRYATSTFVRVAEHIVKYADTVQWANFRYRQIAGMSTDER